MLKNKRLFFIVIVLYAVLFIPSFQWSTQIQAVGILIIVQMLWIGRVFPLAVSSILLMLLLSFHISSFEHVLSFFGNPLVWLLFSTFILAHAFVNTGLASRIALSILSLAKGSGKLLTFVAFMMMFVLTIFIPSNIGKGNLTCAILDDLLKDLAKIQKTDHLGKTLFIGIAYVSAISAAFVPTGASSTVYAFGMFSSVSEDITYISWLLIIGVPLFLFVLLLWAIFSVLFPSESVQPETVKRLIDSKKEKLGTWSSDEKKMAIIIGITLSLWLTQPLHGFSIPLIGLVGAVLVVMPYIGVMYWSEARQGINWDMMIFFAATLMLSTMLIETGTMNVITQYIIHISNDMSPILIVIGFIVLIGLIRIVFVNVLGFLTIVLPLAISLGEQIHSFSALELAMAVYLVGIPGFLLITQSPVHLISYQYGYFSNKDLFKVGSISLLVWFVVVFGSLFFYWQIVL